MGKVAHGTATAERSGKNTKRLRLTSRTWYPSHTHRAGEGSNKETAQESVVAVIVFFSQLPCVKIFIQIKLKK